MHRRCCIPAHLKNRYDTHLLLNEARENKRVKTEVGDSTEGQELSGAKVIHLAEYAEKRRLDRQSKKAAAISSPFIATHLIAIHVAPDNAYKLTLQGEFASSPSMAIATLAEAINRIANEEKRD